MSDVDSATTHPISRIVITGGGTAGWMAAAAVAGMIGTAGVRVTLIESDPSDDVAVGEATVASLGTFNRELGLDENTFVRRTGATVNQGIEFVDWARGGRYLHAFGPHAFNFDTGLYVDYLRKHSQRLGVLRIKDKILYVRKRRGDGFICSLALQSGSSVAGDLFLDCSGVGGVLIARALNVGFEDWRRWLPCDRVVAASSERRAPVLPSTQLMTDALGWRWRIPLRHRTVNGFVYCSDFISELAAQARLLARLDAAALGDIRLLRFTTGHRVRFWEKNCVAIGPAAGFIEPLESTSVHLVQVGLAKLLALLADRIAAPDRVTAYNAYMADEYRRIRDRNILYYKMSGRRDTPFWRRCREMDLPAAFSR